MQKNKIDNKYEIDVVVDIKYTNKNNLSIKDIITALESAEKLIHYTKPVLQSVDGDFRLHDIEVYVQKLESGSLLEGLKTKLIFGSKENQELAEKAFSDFIMNTNMKYLVSMALGAIIWSGMRTFITDQPPTQTTPALATPSITASDNGINIFYLNTTEEKLAEILDKLPNKKQIAQNVTKFVAPAKQDPNAEIQIGNAENKEPIVVVNKEAIKKIPKKYEPPMPTEKQEKYKDIYLEVIALDIENRGKWRGSIDSVTDKAIKMSFAEDIDIQKLSRERFRANVTVIYKYKSDKKDYVANEIYVESLSK